jgi:hypothetical protein
MLSDLVTSQLDPTAAQQTYPKEETALDWLRRARANKCKLYQNPIFFPSISTLGVNEEPYGSQISTRFIVNDSNVVNLAAQSFLCHTGKLNELNHRCQRWRSRRKTNMQRGEDLTELENSFLRSFSMGTGINFIDQILESRKLTSQIALEIVGKTKTGKTKLLMVLAANYAAATSVACMGPIHNFIGHDQMAPVVIFDPNYSIDFEEVVGMVRVAVLRRWNATSEFRQCFKIFVRNQSDSEDLMEPMAEGAERDDSQDIEKDILSVLNRIHIVRPNDISSGYIAALESLRQALDKISAENQGTSFPPVLLLFDSVLSAFQLSNKMQEALPNGIGLSGKNEFLRQVKRLKAKHSIILVSTRTTTGETTVQSRSSCPRWDKMTTHSIAIMKSAVGSPEESEGYDFVALSNHGGSKHALINPFSVTSNGVSCKNGL